MSKPWSAEQSVEVLRAMLTREVRKREAAEAERAHAVRALTLQLGSFAALEAERDQAREEIAAWREGRIKLMHDWHARCLKAEHRATRLAALEAAARAVVASDSGLLWARLPELADAVGALDAPPAEVS